MWTWQEVQPGEVVRGAKEKLVSVLGSWMELRPAKERMSSFAESWAKM